jgi:hypothetical protein
MLTKINIISCETCGRIITRSRIYGFPQLPGRRCLILTAGRHDWRPVLQTPVPHDMAAGYPFGDRDFGLVRVSRIADERADFL